MSVINTIGRMLLGSAIRRTLWRSPRVWLIVAAVAGLALMSIGTARAGTFGCNSNQNPTCVREAAKSACESHVPTLPDYLSPGRCSQNGSMFVVLNKSGNEVGPVPTGRYFFRGTCPPDAPWDEVSKTCNVGNNCSARGNLGSHSVSGATEMCSDGCVYGAGDDVQVCLGQGAGMYCYSKSWKPTGRECSSGPAPQNHDSNRDTCMRKPNATFSECVKNDGTTCVTSAKGNRFCWSPGESGDRMVADGSEGAHKGQGDQQQPPPKGMTDPQSQGTSTHTTTTNNNTTVNSTTVFGGSGTTGGQGDVGKGGNDGSGAGSGSGGGSGSGSGSGSGDDDGDGSGGVGEGVGDLYQESGKTIQSVAAMHANAIRSSEIYQFATGFVTAPGLGGACPVFNISFFDQAITVDVFCLPDMARVWQWVGVFVLALFSWAAFRIAIL